MGLGLYVNENRVAGWSYSGFSNFRRRVAKEIGIVLEEMDGFGGDRKWENIAIQRSIFRFLNHSDCDGTISADMCRKIAPELEKVLSFGDFDPEEYDYVQGMSLVRGMEYAGNHNKPLVFS
jgi:hypothetical protein